MSRAGFITIFLLYALVCAHAAEPTSDDLAFFETKVRPLLVKNCYECHSENSKKLGGKLRLDIREGWQKGGEGGEPALVPGKPEESLLLKAVRYDGLEMPPTGRLPEADIATLEEWIKRGARPRSGSAAAQDRPWKDVFAERSRWWSLQPVRKPPVPGVQHASWSSDEIDRFLLAKMEQSGLAPSSPADRRTLARRASLVLTGLPPFPDEVEQFANDQSPDSYELFVDRLFSLAPFR